MPTEFVDLNVYVLWVIDNSPEKMLYDNYLGINQNVETGFMIQK